jgi:iron complex outermembrane receptor protein
MRGWLLLSVLPLVAQGQEAADTVYRQEHLREVIIIASNDIHHERQPKPLGSVEEYLASAEHLNLIRRGAYGWEPAINHMTTERISVTIEGMKIFHACTDNMDPVTSYVETGNLSEVSIGSGFGGSPFAANSIGGSLDMRLKKTGFCGRGWEASAGLGYETNGKGEVANLGVAYSGEAVYFTGGVSSRLADNYQAGGGEEVRYSQYGKRNVFANAGVLLGERHTIEGTLIYDRAVDVGYPALAMDVAKAQAVITSLSYRVGGWETKVYFNDIVHIMDDSDREEVAIHMDMPGYSRTGGVYSLLEWEAGRHRMEVNVDGYMNRSSAEMVMYPADEAEKPMFMYTWPDARTFYTGMYGSDEYVFDMRHSLRLSGRLSLQREGINDFGVKVLKGFYGDVEPYRRRVNGNVSASYRYRLPRFELSLSAGYGTRAPSVSEAYGFFLFNTFDAYDYIGNPKLDNEGSWETSLSTEWKPVSTLKVRFEASHFYFNRYILGRLSTYSPMTIGSRGVKVYRNIAHANLLNTSLTVDYRFLRSFGVNARVEWCLAEDEEGEPLPLMPPLMGEGWLSYRRGDFSARAGVSWAGCRTRPAVGYGEDKTAAYVLTGLSGGYDFHLGRKTVTLRGGVENLFDVRYSTYADWKNIPRKGRSLYMHLAFTP